MSYDGNNKVYIISCSVYSQMNLVFVDRVIVEVSSVSSVTRAELYNENMAIKLCSNKYFLGIEICKPVI